MSRVRVYALAKELGLDNKELVDMLEQLGVSAKTPSSTIDDATAAAVHELVAEMKSGATAEPKATPAEAESVPEAAPEAVEAAPAPTEMPARERPTPARTGAVCAPIVTVMGHIDHGKTTLLDTIRKTRVTEGEHGGITQHIGASEVEEAGRKIVFIDTPGHAAFTAMRARGAQVTDIVILVVAADDGVMPETREAISHARAAEVPIVVAINKVDLASANVDRVKQQLSDEGLMPEEWGGQTICVPVSALKGEGLQTLLEMLLLVADMEELCGDPAAELDATVIEAHLEQSRGPVAWVVVRNGTLRIGDDIVCGNAHGRIRAMQDWKGSRVTEARARTAVEVVGFAQVPGAGDGVAVVKNQKTARDLASARDTETRSQQLGGSLRMTLEDLFEQVQRGEVRDLNLIIKADTKGSAEALRQELERIGEEFDEVDLHIIHEAVGPVLETDVNLAVASKAIIIGFHVNAEPIARQLARDQHVQIRTYRIIYEATDDIRKAMVGLLPPIFEEFLLGRAEVRDIFRSSKLGAIAGCHVTEGRVVRGSSIRVYRGRDVVYEGRLTSLRRFQDDVAEVSSGFDCGAIVDGYQAWEPGDVIEGFEKRQVARES